MPTATIFDSLETIAANVGAPLELPRIARSSFREELIVVYCVGKGKFSEDTKFINLQMDMYDINGRWIGYQMGVHSSESTTHDLLFPPPPPSPMDRLEVPHPPIKEWTKGVWTFEDGSEIFAVGSAWSQLVPFRDGSFLFMVTTGQLIVDGSGRYTGAHGSKQATGTAFVPPGVIQSGHFPAGGLEFDAKTVEVFRIVKGKDVAPPPAGPTPPPESPAPPGRRKYTEPRGD
ncbi:MAG: hypothetical protein ACRD8O_24615 [Bryobacteraceae bacterium]